MACHYGYLDVVDLLLNGTPYSASMDARSVDDSIPLHYFVRHNPPTVGKKSTSTLRRKLNLKENSAKEKFASGELFFHLLLQLLAGGGGGEGGSSKYANVVNSNGETPLHIACGKCTSTAVIQILIDHGAEVNKTTK